jgi:hypothetical protein
MNLPNRLACIELYTVDYRNLVGASGAGICRRASIWVSISCGDPVGSVANDGRQGERGDSTLRLRSTTEQTVYELSLTYHVALPQPMDLPFLDRMHRLVTFDRPSRAFGRSKSQARVDALLNETVILLQDVVEVR